KHVQKPAIGTRSGSPATGPVAHPQPPTPWVSPSRYKSYSLDVEARSPNGGDRAMLRRGCALVEPHSMRSVSGPPPGNGSMLGGKQLQFLVTKVVPPRCLGLIERPRLLSVVSQL